MPGNKRKGKKANKTAEPDVLSMLDEDSAAILFTQAFNQNRVCLMGFAKCASFSLTLWLCCPILMLIL